MSQDVRIFSDSCNQKLGLLQATGPAVSGIPLTTPRRRVAICIFCLPVNALLPSPRTDEAKCG